MKHYCNVKYTSLSIIFLIWFEYKKYLCSKNTQMKHIELKAGRIVTKAVNALKFYKMRIHKHLNMLKNQFFFLKLPIIIYDFLFWKKSAHLSSAGHWVRLPLLRVKTSTHASIIEIHSIME